MWSSNFQKLSELSVSIDKINIKPEEKQEILALTPPSIPIWFHDDYEMMIVVAVVTMMTIGAMTVLIGVKMAMMT